jgi:2,3-bisphosphoglycerate-dependent phosphoglycerate mutase
MSHADPATITGIIDEAIAAATSWGSEQLELILIRHGQPLPEGERRAEESLDPPLSPLGRRQAEAVAGALDGVDAIYGSDLARAYETARILGGTFGVPVRTLRDLREVAVYRATDGTSEERAWRAAAARFAADGRWASLVQPGLDPSFRARVRRAIGEITAGRTGGTVAVVCHSGVINAHLADTLAMDRDYFVRPAHASITRVRLAAGRWSLHSVNETAHLRPRLLTA